jgi:hypothetical protein
MARVALLALMVLSLAAEPASASTRISWYTRPDNYRPPFWAPYMRIISVSGDSGVNHNIVVKPSGAQQLNGFPQVVDVYDYGDTFVAGPDNPCRVYSPHHAACVASGGPTMPGDSYSYTSYSEIDIGTGDGNDSVQVNDPLNPIITLTSTGAGNDHLTLGNVWDWYYQGGGQSLGSGDDVADIGPSPVTAPPWAWPGALSPNAGDGLLLFAGAGNDAINTLNGSLDQVICDDGIDTWQADPADSNRFASGYGPPVANDCEQRTPPMPLDTSGLP